MKYIDYLKTEIGLLKILANDSTIIGIELVSNQNTEINENDIIKKCKQELIEYFNKTRTKFTCKFEFYGTDFQNKVWKALTAIPYGEIVSYLDIANMIGNPKAVRAVGGAIHNNPILIIIPCHRVIGKNGKLVGFACGLDIKKKLLDIER